MLFFVFLCLKIWLKPDVILPFCAGLPTRLWKLRGEQYLGCLKQRHKIKFPRKSQWQKYDFQRGEGWQSLALSPFAMSPPVSCTMQAMRLNRCASTGVHSQQEAVQMCVHRRPPATTRSEFLCSWIWWYWSIETFP